MILPKQFNSPTDPHYFSPKHKTLVETLPSAEAEALDDLVELIWLLAAPKGWLFTDDDVRVDVGMDDMTVQSASDRSSDAHQAMLFRVLQHRSCLLIGSTE